MSSKDVGCGPNIKESEIRFGLPTTTTNSPDTPPNVVRQNKAIEERYGKETSDMSQMRTTGQSSRFAGPGSS